MYQLVAGASSSSGPAWSALFIAIAGLVLFLTALGWQVLVFFRSGSRVRVEIKFGTFLTQNPVGFLLPGITAAAQIASANSPEQPIYLPEPLVTALRPQNLQNLWLIAEISNIGRLAVTVEGCQWHTAKGKAIERPPATPGVSFPHRLDANDQCIAVIDLRTIIAVLDAPFGTWADWLGIPRHTFSAVFGAVISRGLDYWETFQFFRPGFDLEEERRRRADAGKPEWFGESDLYPDVRPDAPEHDQARR